MRPFHLRPGRATRSPRRARPYGSVAPCSGCFASPGCSPGTAQAQAGTLDPSFGTGGKVTTDFAGSFDQANALVAQRGARLVAAGVAFTDPVFSDFALARYRSADVR